MKESSLSIKMDVCWSCAYADVRTTCCWTLVVGRVLDDDDLF